MLLSTIILQAAGAAVWGKVAGALGAGVAALAAVSVRSDLLQWIPLHVSLRLPETSVLQCLSSVLLWRVLAFSQSSHVLWQSYCKTLCRYCCRTVVSFSG